MYKNKEDNKDNNSGCWWIIGIFLALLILSHGGEAGTGPKHPFDETYYDDLDAELEFYEGKNSNYEYADAKYGFMAETETSYQKTFEVVESYSNEMIRETQAAELDSNGNSSCPYGCTYHKPGCDIKGNISIETGEKIFHIKGQEYYYQTNINPEYGERWFCTEQEAINNGWRKSWE